MAFKKPEVEDDIIGSKDGRVIFEPATHTYYYNKQPLISVTQFIKMHTKPFDTLFSSINKAKKNKTDKHGIHDPKILRKYWRLQAERSTNYGTAAHAYSEMYMLDRNSKPKTGFDMAVKNAIIFLEKEFDIIEQEEIVYNTNYMIAGSIDLKLKHKKTGEIYIGDWKITEDMNKSYNKLEKPFELLNDSALNKYSIQLDLYIMLSSQLISELNKRIIQLHDNGDFTIYSPTAEDENYKIPFTMDKTRKAVKIYMQENKPLNFE